MKNLDFPKISLTVFDYVYQVKYIWRFGQYWAISMQWYK